MKILSACANSSGTSLMLSRTATKAMKDLGFNVTTSDHTSVSEAKGTARNYDVVFTSLPFVKMFDEAEKRGAIVIGVKNVMSKQEVEDAVKNNEKLQAKLNK